MGPRSLSTGGTFHITFDGTDKTGDVTVPVTSGWQTWETVSATAVLSVGEQVMRFTASTSGFNVNYFDIQGGISAVLPDPSTVNLTIYNVAGKLVRTLVAGETVGVGRHEVVWNGRDEIGRVAAAGVHF